MTALPDNLDGKGDIGDCGNKDENLDPTPAASDPPLAPGLYLVATPIGNLEDITLRALRVLRSVDRVACEDTRQSQKLLNHFGIRKPTVSYHLHNEGGRSSELVGLLRAGGRLALVSDAGMPGIADPGLTLVREAIEAGIPVFPVPGANAALSALIASGLATERFTFHGFLPAREGQRRTMLERVRDALAAASELAAGTQIFYETPHRLLGALEDVVTVFGPGQRLVLARELTKLHEEFLHGTVSEVLTIMGARSLVRGEMVLLLEGRLAHSQESHAEQNSAGSLADEVKLLMTANQLSEKDALKQVAKRRGLGKSEAYREWQRSRNGKR